MQNFKPTHFIEQYNSTGLLFSDRSKCHFGVLQPISSLKGAINYTKNCEMLKTVAIFRIQFKDDIKIN